MENSQELGYLKIDKLINYKRHQIDIDKLDPDDDNIF